MSCVQMLLTTRLNAPVLLKLIGSDPDFIGSTELECREDSDRERGVVHPGEVPSPITAGEEDQGPLGKGPRSRKFVSGGLLSGKWRNYQVVIHQNISKRE